MKVILSRKGFDSAYGGFPSPILPDGRMVSLPIPSNDLIKYEDIKINNGLTYCGLMKQLRSKIKKNGCWKKIDQETRCHLDPDINRDIIERRKNWRPCFGQVGSAQSHLEKRGVCENDIFLYFGWFRKTIIRNDKYEFDPLDKGMHAIFGYLQIGEILKVGRGCTVPDWISYHSHISKRFRGNNSNTIYIGRNELSWNRLIPGAGIFPFKEDLVLTKKGLSRSKWRLLDCLKDAEISYHSGDSWREGYFQSASIGQEFVINDNEMVSKWTRKLIEGEGAKL